MDHAAMHRQAAGVLRVKEGEKQVDAYTCTVEVGMY